MKFIVKGLAASGQVASISIEAHDEQQARRAASEQGVRALSVVRQNPWTLLLRPRRARFAIDLFSQELIALLDAGLTLVEAIELLADKEHGKAGGTTLESLRDHLRRGLSLSQSLDQLPGQFPPLYVATVRAAEKTGDLKEALGRYLDYHQQIDKVRRKIVSASVYPVLLIVVGLLVGAFMLLYVVPRFSRIYDEIGGQLPWLTRLLIGWGQMLETHALATFAALAAAIALAGWGLSRPAFMAWLAPRLWRIPAVGERMRIYELSRFYRTLGMLLKSGMPLPAALDMAGGLLSGLVRSGLERAGRDIREGQGVSRAFEVHGLTTRVSARLLGVGERSGRLPQMVERIAMLYEEELARFVDWFTRLFEPLLMILIGALIGLIVVLLYLPIFELAENVR